MGLITYKNYNVIMVGVLLLIAIYIFANYFYNFSLKSVPVIFCAIIAFDIGVTIRPYLIKSDDE